MSDEPYPRPASQGRIEVAPGKFVTMSDDTQVPFTPTPATLKAMKEWYDLVMEQERQNTREMRQIRAMYSDGQWTIPLHPTVTIPSVDFDRVWDRSASVTNPTDEEIDRAARRVKLNEAMKEMRRRNNVIAGAQSAGSLAAREGVPLGDNPYSETSEDTEEVACHEAWAETWIRRNRQIKSPPQLGHVPGWKPVVDPAGILDDPPLEIPE
jgi:hypothetical protein